MSLGWTVGAVLIGSCTWGACFVLRVREELFLLATDWELETEFLAVFAIIKMILMIIQMIMCKQVGMQENEHIKDYIGNLLPERVGEIS